MSDAIEADRLKRIRSHIGQSIVREIETVTLSTADALFLHSAALTAYERRTYAQEHEDDLDV